MSKHTPGPWVIANWVGRRVLEPAKARYPHTQYVCELGGVIDQVGGDLEANHRLLAAAPEMLEALEALLAEPYGCPRCDSGKLRNPDKAHTDDCPYVLARAAVAKALHG